MQIKKVILVFKTHFDIGFTKLSREILEYYAGEMLDRVKETCDATRDMGALKYVWTMPAWPLKIMRERADDTRGAMLDDLVQRGQLTWHALPYTSHYDFAGIEDGVWGLRYGKELSQRYDMPLRRAAKMTDVPGHNRFLPELLADGGVRFLHLGCNEFAMPPQVPPIFWWEAPSGKRVLTMYSQGYGTTLFPPENWPFSTWMALMNTNDNCGPQTAEIVSEVYGQIHERYPDAEVVSGTLDDMWDALSGENLAEIPVVRGDLADTWIHGAASYPRESATIRRLRGRLARVNRALALSEQTLDSVSKDVAAAYDAMALFEEHTWGLDVKRELGAIPSYDRFEAYRKTSPACARMEESWREQTQRAETAEAACARAERALGLAGPKDFCFTEGEPLHGEQSLTGGRYRLDFSADTGVIHGLYDRKRGRCLLRERDGVGVFSYRYDRYGAEDLTEYLRGYARRFTDWGVLDNGRAGYPECDHVTRVPEFVSCERRDHTLKLTYDAAPGQRLGDASRVRIFVRVPEGDGPVRVRVELTGKGATPYIESGALCMPLAAEHPDYYVNKMGTVLRPERDIVRGANHAFYALEHFIAAEGDDALVGVVSHDCPLVSIGENGVHQFRMEYEEHAPEFRFCLFNNMWGTNFPQWIEGDMAFEFDVLSENPGEIGRVYAQACALAENPDSDDAPSLPFTLSDGLRATTLMREGNSLLLRVHNCEGTPTHGSIRSEGWRFEEIDLMGRPMGDTWLDAVETEFAPYELRTFRAERAS